MSRPGVTQFCTEDLVEQAGTQGVELLNWVVARAALTGGVHHVHANYHIPISNTATGLLVLEGRGRAATSPPR